MNERQLLAVRRGENNALAVPADFVQDGKVLLDVRTVFDDQIDPLVEAVQAAVAGSS